MGKPRCAVCSGIMHGVDHRMDTRSSRRPERPYGGCICHRCLDKGVREAVRRWALKVWSS
ncbi:MAG: hypothetical protein RMJ00_07220 [Nitrososphaerota archaeon]|nr:hypothetical protein [Candidatus Bathyarchaeota archaeon]MDW8062470.1 hypothetical protein [Nitrososphaerota archaeon]